MRLIRCHLNKYSILRTAPKPAVGAVCVCKHSNTGCCLSVSGRIRMVQVGVRDVTSGTRRPRSRRSRPSSGAIVQIFAADVAEAITLPDLHIRTRCRAMPAGQLKPTVAYALYQFISPPSGRPSKTETSSSWSS
ncbi:hypothetical protein EVAR_88391_1 [Eumeta japonica]|uniref:Uncharacterized protein n=1 Tax=Eumeta variegata TaxID=151549 RepID=A0A4C1XCJ8_EUMVA|nr:hypothetical protein EVAR_88391_1 [Eumeta japonica]